LTNVAGTQFDMMTPENDMKWDTVQPAQTTFNFGPGDQIVNFARSHNQRLRGHNLVWHSQLPGWVSSLPTNQVQAAMENHITMEVNHWRGLYAWDVVNEPFNEDGSLRSDPFLTAMGSGYIADALRTARAADPNAKLYLNDFNIEANNTAKSNAMFSLAQSLLNSGAPLNGIGFEAHFIQGQVPSSLPGEHAALRQPRSGRRDHRAGRTDADRQPEPPGPGKRLPQRGQRLPGDQPLRRHHPVERRRRRLMGPGYLLRAGSGDHVRQQLPAEAGVHDRAQPAEPGCDHAAAHLGHDDPTADHASTDHASADHASADHASTDHRPARRVHRDVHHGEQLAARLPGRHHRDCGRSAINGWTLTWTLSSGQTITDLWNGARTVSGTSVTVRNLSYNGSIPRVATPPWASLPAVPRPRPPSGAPAPDGPLLPVRCQRRPPYVAGTTG
jgi:endo-1,4-beta-xylanase